jgi:hypothetical protein
MRLGVNRHFHRFNEAIDSTLAELQMMGAEVDTGHWQGVTTAGKPDLKTVELINHTFEVLTFRPSWFTSPGEWLDEMTREIKPNLPWADAHFVERIGGIPYNPDPSHVLWPWWHGQDDETKEQGKFTHTYSERFWPREAGGFVNGPNWDEGVDNMGLRYRLGDYNDLLDLLTRRPFTRQAWLPIFFPEDTGAVHGGRIPCTLGYQFMLRDGQLHLWYVIRSCDAVRHFQDDVYLAVRLLGHTLNLLQERELRSDREQVWVDVEPGNFYFTAFSLHVHKGDAHRVAAG